MQPFRVGLTREFAPGGALAGLLNRVVGEVLDGVPHLEVAFLDDDKPVVTPDQIRDFDAVITGESRWPAASFQGVERLAGIAYWGVGYDGIDIEAATNADVMVAIAAPAARRPMAEAILTFMLALSKNLLSKDRLTRAGHWAATTRNNGILLRDRVIGLIGVGNIGSDLVTLLQPFAPARLIAFDPYLSPERATALGVELTSLGTLLRESDFVSVTCPLTDETRHMLGEAQFRLMKPTAYFINAARGGIVDQPALVRALAEGWIKGAGLDVFEPEPPAPDDPLLTMDNVIVTAHCLGWTDELSQANSVEDCKAVVNIYHGRPPDYVVNPAVLERPGLQAKLRRFAERGVA
ncbi:MAG: NAD(P)-dependent oxidoreductase [Thermomicrobiales bacterium]